jgi:hypothetical protein
MGFSAMVVAFSVASAQEQPAAIVEDVAGNEIGVEIMEILARGKVIDLSPGQSVVLGYMNSCVRERIEAGRVVVGDVQSTVTGGHVEREVVACHSKGAAMAIGTSEGTGLIFRGGENNDPEREPTLRYRAPVIVADGAASATLRIERLDQNEALRYFSMPGPALDLAGKNGPLTPGGRYRASVDGREAVFAIHKHAANVSGPVLERLVRLDSE